MHGDDNSGSNPDHKKRGAGVLSSECKDFGVIRSHHIHFGLCRPMQVERGTTAPKGHMEPTEN